MMVVSPAILEGKRTEVSRGRCAYPEAFERLADPPQKLYVVGRPEALMEGLAVVGARFATPYGLGSATRFAGIASHAGITIISGGARGCDAAAHDAALENGGSTVVFLGGGCDNVYPRENFPLFQRVVDSGGAIVSEHEWGVKPVGYMFRLRNRLIASLAKATLIVEAGLPSGTFSTADEAISAGRELLVVPGSITSRYSYGANRLIYQGATPIIDNETFIDQMNSIFGECIEDGPKSELCGKSRKKRTMDDIVFEMLSAQPCSVDMLLERVNRSRKEADNLTWLLHLLSNMQRENKIARYPDGSYGAVVS